MERFTTIQPSAATNLPTVFPAREGQSKTCQIFQRITTFMPLNGGLQTCHGTFIFKIYLLNINNLRKRFVDGQVKFSFQITSNFKPDLSPHYWILNSAVGGGYPGNPDSTTKFPNYFGIFLGFSILFWVIF